MSIPVETPEIEIRVYKLTGMNRGEAYRGAAAVLANFDLSQYLGEAGSVRTTKSLHEPCGGFSISFADRIQQDMLDTIYALVEPMDMVEIRMRRAPGGTGRLPLVMRGFVSKVRRVETLAQDGTPQRTVVISGQDEGKLWMIHQLLPETIYASQSPYMDTFSLLAAVGIQVGVMPVADFMQQLVEVVMNDKVAALQAFATAYVPPFIPDISVPQGLVVPSLVQPFRKGPFWNLAELVADRPWNELWVESTEDGPVVHFRPVPYRDLGGAYIMPGAADPGWIYRDVEDVVSWDAERTDTRVANFYFVPPGGAAFDTNAQANVATLQDGSLQDYEYGNSARDLFGLRKMETVTRLLPDSVTQPPNRYPPGERMAAGQNVIDWHKERALQLKAFNRDNVALEDESLTLKGSEELKVGRYISITRGQIPNAGLVTEAYVTKVDHAFMPMRTWTTTILAERGNGFLNRDAMASSPYWAEGARGIYR